MDLRYGVSTHARAQKLASQMLEAPIIRADASSVFGDGNAS